VADEAPGRLGLGGPRKAKFWLAIAGRRKEMSRVYSRHVAGGKFPPEILNSPPEICPGEFSKSD